MGRKKCRGSLLWNGSLLAAMAVFGLSHEVLTGASQCITTSCTCITLCVLGQIRRLFLDVATLTGLLSRPLWFGPVCKTEMAACGEARIRWTRAGWVEGEVGARLLGPASSGGASTRVDVGPEECSPGVCWAQWGIHDAPLLSGIPLSLMLFL
jgi:hypothetical protein